MMLHPWRCVCHPIVCRAVQVRHASSSGQSTRKSHFKYLAQEIRQLQALKRKLQRAEENTGKKLRDASVVSNLVTTAKRQQQQVHLFGDVPEDNLTILPDDTIGPTSMTITPEEAPSLKLRDLGADGANYDTAMATLKDRGVDVPSLFESVGCPPPSVVLLHLIAAAETQRFDLMDAHIAAVLDRHAKEMALMEQRDRADELKRAYRMRDACADAGLPFELLSTTALLRCAVEAGDLDKACEVFREMVAVSSEPQYSLLMRGAVEAGEADFALSLYHEMKERKLPCGEQSALQAIAAHALLGNIEEAIRIRDTHAGKRGAGNTALNLGVLRALAMKGRYEEAKEFASSDLARGTMPEHQVVPLLVEAAAAAGDVAAGIAAIEEASSKGVPLTLAPIHALLRACDAPDMFLVARLAGNLRLALSGETIEIILMGIALMDPPDLALVKQAMELCEVHEVPLSTASRSVLVHTLSRIGEVAEAWAHFDVLRTGGGEADDEALEALLVALAFEAAPLSQIFSVFAAVKRRRTETWRMLADALLRTTQIAPALKFIAQVAPDIDSKIVPATLPRTVPADSVAEIVALLRGYGKVHVLSSLAVLEASPEVVLNCNRLIIPMSVILSQVDQLDPSALADLLSLPHVDVLLLAEEILMHSICLGPDGWGASHGVDLGMQSHRVLLASAVLHQGGLRVGCAVEVVAGEGPENPLAAKLGVPVKRITTPESPPPPQ